MFLFLLLVLVLVLDFYRFECLLATQVGVECLAEAKRSEDW
jgi:hypothetical protein